MLLHTQAQPVASSHAYVAHNTHAHTVRYAEYTHHTCYLACKHVVNCIHIACPVMVDEHIDLLHCCVLPQGTQQTLECDYVFVSKTFVLTPIYLSVHLELYLFNVYQAF